MKTYLDKRLQQAKESAGPIKTKGDAKRAEKFRKQIIRKGYCDADLWSLNTSLAEYILPQLREFRNCTGGHPCSLKSTEAWQAIIDKMIWAFDMLIQENDWPNWETKKKGETDNQWLRRLEAIREEMQKGFELFGKWFPHLWN